MGTTAISRRHNNNTLYVAMDSSFYLQPQLAPELQTLRSSRIHTISIWLSKVHLQSIRSKTELLIFCLRFSYLVNDTNLVAQAKNTELFFILFFFSPPSCNTLARPYHQYISRTTHFSPSPRPPSWYKANAMVQVLSACTAATASYKLPCFYRFLYNYFSTAQSDCCNIKPGLLNPLSKPSKGFSWPS